MFLLSWTLIFVCLAALTPLWSWKEMITTGVQNKTRCLATSLPSRGFVRKKIFDPIASKQAWPDNASASVNSSLFFFTVQWIVSVLDLCLLTLVWWSWWWRNSRGCLWWGIELAAHPVLWGCSRGRRCGPGYSCSWNREEKKERESLTMVPKSLFLTCANTLLFTFHTDM